MRKERGLFSIVTWIARIYVWQRLQGLLPGGKRPYLYSINAMRARHPAWFLEDLRQLFDLLAQGSIRPRIAERIGFEQVAEAHRSLEAGGLSGKLVLCPDLGASRAFRQGR